MTTSLRALPIRSILSYPARTTLVRSSRILSPATVTQRRKMADMTPIMSKDAPKPAAAYSHAIKTPTAIYCSGQIHLDLNNKLVTEGSIGDKTALCIKNLEAVLATAGSSIGRIVKVNIFLSDMEHFQEFNKEYEKWFTHKPARSCVAVKQLPLGAEVEIECIALPGTEAS